MLLNFFKLAPILLITSFLINSIIFLLKEENGTPPQNFKNPTEMYKGKKQAPPIIHMVREKTVDTWCMFFPSFPFQTCRYYF